MSARRRAPLALHVLGLAYGRVASWRRAWYARHPDARRRLTRPVISVGNLVVGGSGKTPLVAALARWLIAEGERPAILSRGYARRVATDGVLVVSDTGGVLEPVERSGDEPQMLARSLAGVPVLVGADRYLAGSLAERQFGCTVHLLDDGFQHLALARDVDLLLVAPRDLDDEVVPAGTLREPIAAVALADAVLFLPDPMAGADDGSQRLFGQSFETQVIALPPRLVQPFGEPLPMAPPARALAVAGIARPKRFFSTAREQGWDVVGEIIFRDHHWFTAADVAGIRDAARAAGAGVILTTEKDAVRLQPLVSSSLAAAPPFAFLPIEIRVDPAPAFSGWLRDRLHAARAAGVREVA